MPDRRRTLGYLGATGIGVFAGCSRTGVGFESGFESGAGGEAGEDAPENVVCLVRPEQTEGPYFVDERLNRSNIRADAETGAVKAGVALEVTLRVYDASSGCVPLAGAVVDLWQCDAAGVYSDVPELATAGVSFLRGYQLADSAGSATFSTIYPGWYPGRTPHLHFKVRYTAASGAAYAFTSQLYFEEAYNEAILRLAPYDARGPRTVTNASDGIFRAGGDELLLPLQPVGAGYRGSFALGLLLD